jgi:hypothetical protein
MAGAGDGDHRDLAALALGSHPGHACVSFPGGARAVHPGQMDQQRQTDLAARALPEALPLGLGQHARALHGPTLSICTALQGPSIAVRLR